MTRQVYRIKPANVRRIPGLSLTLFVAALFAAPDLVSPAPSEVVSVDKLLIVDCLLPGQMRKLGGKMTYLGPRRAVRAAASECEIRGGEYVAYDRANYSTALHVWLPLAENGDARAQVYVGEIYEKGMGTAPDYVKAASWYEKAAQKGDVQGLNHSAYLYEQGLGVNKDPVGALNLYRRAAGITGDDLTFKSEVNAVRDEAQAKIDQLSAQLEERDRGADALSKTLDDTRRQLKEKELLADRAKHEADELRRRLRQLQAAPQTTANTQELAHLKSELSDRDVRLSAQRAEIEKLHHDSSEQSDTLRARLAEAEQEDAALQKQLGVAQAQLISSRAELKAVTAKALALDQETSDLRTQLRTGESALDAAQAQLQHARSVQGEADRQHGDQLKAAATQQQLQLDRQKAVISTLDDQRRKLEAERLQLQAVVAAAQQQNNQDQDTTAGLRAHLASTQTDLLRKTQEQQELSSQLEAAARQIAQDNKTLTASAGAAGGKDTEIQRLNRELANREAILTEQRAQMAALATIIASDRQSLKEYQGKLNDLGQTRGIPSSSVSVAEALSPAFGLGQNYALIFGNEKYQHLPQLQSAVKDADEVERVLKERYGFKGHTVILRNAKREEMITALYDIVKAVGAQDSLIIYYAGHGTLDKVTQQSYWLPIDADNGNPSNWLSDHDITNWVSETKARHVLIIADSCYAGAMTHGTTAQLVSNGKPDAERKRMLLLAKLPSRTVLTSGGLEPVLDSGPDGHSIFAHEFIDLLDRNTQVMEATSLYTTLADRVRMSAMRVGEITGKTINQVPQISWLADAGHEAGGEFLFVPIAPPRAAISVRPSFPYVARNSFESTTSATGAEHTLK